MGEKAKIKPFSHISFTGTDGSWLWNFLINMIYFQAFVLSPFGAQISFFLGEHGYAYVRVCKNACVCMCVMEWLCGRGCTVHRRAITFDVMNNDQLNKSARRQRKIQFVAAVRTTERAVDLSYAVSDRLLPSHMVSYVKHHKHCC